MKAILVALMLFALPLAASALPAKAPAPAPASAPVPAQAGNLVSEGELHRVIGNYLIQRTSALNAQVSIKKIGYQGEMKLPAGRVSFEVIAPDRWEGYGHASVALIVRVDDQVKKNLTVLVEVEALAEMVVATRTLERGEVLMASDLALARRDLSQVQGRFIKSMDEALGLRVKSVIRANSPVRGDYLERVPIVKSGQMVTILVENEVVRITASGRAKGAGALGDIIMVQNLSSQKDLAARVVDATTVRVDF
jgi:flagella basal body P-ring formation protein FlgA